MPSGEHIDDAEAAVLDRQFDAARAQRADEGIAHQDMRARLRSKLFGAPPEPVKLGRFVILERLGQGGMGVVYAAYDPELDRRVALKLIRTGAGMGGKQAVERLHREAQALARLSHPNVVPVYDVGVIDDQVFIVMEFVVGKTLREWAGAEERSWQDVLDAYRQAGQGLAAAHEVGLVHRDFKPDNVLFGEDGRVRVLDFGLARARLSEALPDEPEASGAGLDVVAAVEPRAAVEPPAPLEPMDVADTIAAAAEPVPVRKERRASTSGLSGSGPIPSNKLLEQPLTMTGAVVGTPAFMSPEQFKGGRVDAKSDQFSFCLALYEGLYGQRAFAGSTLAELEDNVCRGEPRPAPEKSRVPRWIAPILARGLARDPAGRYPSMADLLAALARDPARARKRRLMALVFVALVGITAYSWVRAGGGAAEDVCSGARRELAGAWNSARRAAVEQALAATGLPYAGPAWEQVSAGLDRYADAWVAMHENACRAHQRGEQSGALLDRRMACLQSRRVAMDSAVAVLSETDADSLDKAVDVVQALPSVDYCGNVEALTAEVAPPEHPEVARRVDDIRARLSRATALESAGRYPEASELVASLTAEAEALAYRPLLAELRLLEGRIDIATGRGEDAIEPLSRAAALGLGTGMERVGLEALARYVYVQGASSKASVDTSTVLLIAEALLETIPDSGFAHALLLNNAGVVRLAQGDRDQARAYFERALAVKQRALATPVELTGILVNLSLVTEDAERRMQLMSEAAAEREHALGAVHPQTLVSRLVQSFGTSNPEMAHSLLDDTCNNYALYHPQNHDQLGLCLYYLGFLDAEMGDTKVAAERFASAANHYEATASPWLRELARGYGLMYADECESALDSLAAAQTQLEPTATRWWHKKRLAEIESSKGMCLMALGRVHEAQGSLERAYALFSEVLDLSQNTETRLRWARTMMALASALWPASNAALQHQVSEESRDRARDLIDRATAWYRAAGEGYEGHLREIAEWRRARGLSE